MKRISLSLLLCFQILTQLGCASLLPQESYQPDADELAEFQADASEEAHEAHEIQKTLEYQRIRRAVDYRDLVPGMNMNQVVSIWGEPADVEVAGDPRRGNQRWVYYDGMSSRMWTLSPKREVYFESGRVVGWNTLNP